MSIKSPTKVQLVALISGGKDSLYSMLHCLQNGYTIVAIGNLEPKYHLDAATDYPPGVGGSEIRAVQSEDIESHLYQTVGHASIPLFEQVLGVPLYRRQITGNRVDQSRTYRTAEAVRETDETEDLTLLLQDVIQHHPDVRFVSTGAILSDYQRTRVESVCHRLDLTSIAYLWQYPSLPIARSSWPDHGTGLLEDMQAVGLEARLIKVASAGLTTDDLWDDVCSSEVRRRLRRCMGRYSSGEELEAALIGEGGEYETLCVAGPLEVWRGSLVVDHTDLQKIPRGAGSAHLRYPQPSVKWNTDMSRHRTESELSPIRLPLLAIPQLLDPEFFAILNTLGDPLQTQSLRHPLRAADHNHNNPAPGTRASVHRDHSSLICSNMNHAGSTMKEQANSGFQLLLQLLRDNGLTACHLTHTVVCLRSMSEFPILNQIYEQYLGHPDPPARVTIACGDWMPAERMLLIHATASLADPEDHRALHVQSRSYWAPANIGPYSQAVAVARSQGTSSASSNGEVNSPISLVQISGQIPLVPSTMNLPTYAEVFPYLAHSGESGFLTALAAQHLWRIGRVMKVRVWINSIAFLSSAGGSLKTRMRLMQKRAVLAASIWSQRCGKMARDAAAEESGQETGASADLEAGSSFDVKSSSAPGFFAVQVHSLPRDACIEYHATGLAISHEYHSTLSSSLSLGVRHHQIKTVPMHGLECELAVALTVTEIDEHRTVMQGTATPHGPEASGIRPDHLARCVLEHAGVSEQAVVSTSPDTSWKISLLRLYTAELDLHTDDHVEGRSFEVPVQWIPAEAVFDQDGQPHQYGFILELERKQQ